MKIVTAFDSFKGCMTAKEACLAAAQALREMFPNAEIVNLPISDGGEGMVNCILNATASKKVELSVHGPLMETRETWYAVSQDGKTAYMEMAAASGLCLVPEDKRNPTLTTTYGVGEMMADAIRRGVREIIMGIGGSATCDVGEGMLRALSERLWGEPLAPEKIQWERFQQLGVKLTVACDVANPLFGPEGAAYVFAPQKGATAEQVRQLDEQLRSFAHKTEANGIATPQLAYYPGTGAAGGLGYALLAYLQAELKSGIDLVLDAIHFDSRIQNADCILTGEGKTDRQTIGAHHLKEPSQENFAKADAMGFDRQNAKENAPKKVPMGVLMRAHAPVHLYSGLIEDESELLNCGFSSVHSINEGDNRPLPLLLEKETAQCNLKRSIRKTLTLYNV